MCSPIHGDSLVLSIHGIVLRHDPRQSSEYPPIPPFCIPWWWGLVQIQTMWRFVPGRPDSIRFRTRTRRHRRQHTNTHTSIPSVYRAQNWFNRSVRGITAVGYFRMCVSLGFRGWIVWLHVSIQSICPHTIVLQFNRLQAKCSETHPTNATTYTHACVANARGMRIEIHVSINFLKWNLTGPEKMQSYIENVSNILTVAEKTSKFGMWPSYGGSGQQRFYCIYNTLYTQAIECDVRVHESSPRCAARILWAAGKMMHWWLLEWWGGLSALGASDKASICSSNARARIRLKPRIAESFGKSSDWLPQT